MFNFLFRVQYRAEQATQWQEKELDAVNLARDLYRGGWTIPRLRHATVYLARVASKNAYGYNDYGTIFKFATKGAGGHKNSHFYLRKPSKKCVPTVSSGREK